MSEIQVFKNSEFGEIRTVVRNGDPYFCLIDVCQLLDIKNSGNVRQRLSGDWVHSMDPIEYTTNGSLDTTDATSKGIITEDIVDNLGRTRQATFINESNLYKVIFQSRKPEAERFTEWVTSEVLPSIRKNGVYAKDELLDNPDLLLDIISKLKVEREAKLAAEKKLELQAPKVEAYDTMLDSKSALYIREVAKLLNSPEWGEKRLFRFLKNSDILMDNNEPYQKYIDKGYFRVIARTYKVFDETRTGKTTLVLPKGVDYILKLVNIK